MTCVSDAKMSIWFLMSWIWALMCCTAGESISHRSAAEITCLQITSEHFIARVNDHWKEHGSLQPVDRIWGKDQQDELEGFPKVN